MISRLSSFLILASIVAATAATPSAQQEEASQPAPRFATVFTFLDAVFNTRKVWNRADVSDAMERARELGVQRIYWRVDAGGMFVYPTNVGTPYRWDGRDPSANLVDSIKTLGDPLQVFAEEAHQRGIELYAWYPIRDRNSTSHSYNPKNPKEAEQYERVGRYASVSRFYLENPHYNMERRQGAGEGIVAPLVKEIVIRTDASNQTLSSADVQIWQSDDNLSYEPVPDTWTVKHEQGEGTRFRITNLSIDKPWVKLAQRKFGQWRFSGGDVDEWITFVDNTGREWFPYPWMASADREPEVGEARFPFKTAKRAKHVRNGVPWDAITKFQFGPGGHSMSFYTPAMPPDRYLIGYPCFAYPEVREYERKVIDELLERDIDGIALSVRTHVRSNGTDEYGFNPPIAEEYLRKHGRDPRLEDYDGKKHEEVLGDAYTEMVKIVSAATHAKGKKLVAMFEPESDRGLEWQPGQMMPWWGLGRTEWQWERWAKEKHVDQLLIMTTGFNLPWDNALESYLKEVRERAGDVPVSLHYDPDYNPARQSSAAYQKLVRSAMNSSLIDELNIFEFVEFWSPKQPLYKATRSLKLNERLSNDATQP